MLRGAVEAHLKANTGEFTGSSSGGGWRRQHARAAACCVCVCVCSCAHAVVHCTWLCVRLRIVSGSPARPRAERPPRCTHAADPSSPRSHAPLPGILPLLSPSQSMCVRWVTP